MAARDEIIAFLDELLDSPAFDDYGPNGLQVVGAAEVSTVVTGVSAHLELFERAAEEGAQMVLCHHGILWNKQPLVVDAQRRARLEALFAADMSLAAYHLPLDAHPEVGNNALSSTRSASSRSRRSAIRAVDRSASRARARSRCRGPS